jgi:hypothetical protein
MVAGRSGECGWSGWSARLGPEAGTKVQVVEVVVKVEFFAISKQ